MHDSSAPRDLRKLAVVEPLKPEDEDAPSASTEPRLGGHHRVGRSGGTDARLGGFVVVALLFVAGR